MAGSDADSTIKVGRPPINLEEYFMKIQPFLQLGYSLHKACIYGQIPYTSLKPYYDSDEDFRNKIDREKTMTNVVARKNLVNAIKQGDLKSSLEWLQAHEKEDWSKRQEVQDVTPRDNKTVLLLKEIINNKNKDNKTITNESKDDKEATESNSPDESHENNNGDIPDKEPTDHSE